MNGMPHVSPQKVTYHNYKVVIDSAVADKMDPYMDKYLAGEAWTALTEEVNVSIKEADTTRADGLAHTTVTTDEKGNFVTNVSITDVNGNVLGSTSVSEHNKWDEYYGKDVLRTRRLNGETEQQLDEYVSSDQGYLDKYTNPTYKLSEEEEKDAKERIEKFWDEHQDISGIRENGDLKEFYLSYKGEEEISYEEWLRLNGIDDMDEYNQAVQYYNLEHKLSNGDAFFNGATQVFYNAGVATDNFLDKMCGEPGIDPNNPFGYSEHDLEIMALSDEVKEDRAIARQNSKLQNPYAYTAGRITQMTATTMFAGGMLSSSGLVSEVASFAGGGKLATALTEVGLETLLVDIPTDTIPEMIANFDSGMSVDEVLKQAGINVLVNTGVNVLGDVAIPGALEVGAKVLGDTGVDKALGDATEDAFKAFSDGTEDVLKTSSDALDGAADSLKLADDALDAGKAIPDVSDTAKVIENGADVAKVANNGSDVAKVLDNSSDAAEAIGNSSDVAKAIDNGTDAAKTINNGTDTFKAIGDSTDTARAVESSADTVKAIGNSSDVAKVSEDVAEASKNADHVTNSSKVAENFSDIEEVVDIADDSSKAIDESVGVIKEKNQAIEYNVHQEDTAKVIENGRTRQVGNTLYDDTIKTTHNKIIPPEQINGGTFDVDVPEAKFIGDSPVSGAHNATVKIIDSGGDVKRVWREVSGNATDSEKALGPGKMQQATHTEQRALTRIELTDETILITGQNPPCKNCQGAMRLKTLNNNGTIIYQWRENGKTVQVMWKKW